MWRSLLLFGSLLYATAAMELPEYIKPCARTDPDFNACVLKSAQESVHRFSLGDTSRGLKPLDPLYVPEMDVYIPNKQGFRVIFKDSYFKGFSDMQVQGLKFDMKKKVITTDALVNMDVSNTYELSGRFMFIPIKSSGDSHFNLINALLHIRYWYDEVVGEDGKTHWKINKNDVTYKLEKATFRLENLLNNKNIGDQINKILNDMWREVVDGIGPTICSSLGDAVVENVAVLLNQVSFDEMFPE